MAQDFYKSASQDKVFEAYGRIRAALNHHRSPPGSFLNIRLVAARLKISTTPVREALIRLANEEVVGFIRGRGYHTLFLSSEELTADHEFAMVMMKYAMEAKGSGVLEKPAIGPGQLWEGRPVIEELQAIKINALVEELYATIARLSGNGRVVRNMGGFCARTGHIRQYGLMSSSAIREALSSLDELAAALRNGCRDHAVRIAQRHTDLIIGALPGLVRDLNNRANSGRTAVEDLL
ncbi:GntR family transcriptional regulator [Neorhizobium sp. T25_13]|uniref:GntR family transcriptional regulator n=1 Tax=Neorhizobium sp. T25_13 TaxID=2093830 RepID=UPI000CF9A1F9|nr:GntR family transcriptional regulator [Neorhizobium sp. T25_13]